MFDYSVQFGRQRGLSRIKVVIDRSPDFEPLQQIAVGLDQTNKLMIADIDVLGIEANAGNCITNHLGDEMHNIVLLTGSIDSLNEMLFDCISDYEVRAEHRCRDRIIELASRAYDDCRSDHIFDDGHYKEQAADMAIEAMGAGGYWQIARDNACKFIRAKTMTYHGMPAMKMSCSQH
jgi:hypothetical protein